jgi:hypothetical protein
VAALRGLRDALPGAVLPMARVFPTMPTAKTFARDLERAKIPKADAQGRVVDLHALRGTLATDLASRVAPAVAQRALRHAKSETTLRHYVSVEDVTVAKAIDARPWLTRPAPQESTAAAATGTDGMQQHQRQQSAPPEAVRGGSEGCGSARDDRSDDALSVDGAERVFGSDSAVPRGSLRLAAGGEVVGDEGLEPSTPSLSSWCSSQLS